VLESSDGSRTSVVFTGGIRSPLGRNATWPFIALELSTEGLHLRLRFGLLAWAIPDLDQEPIPWSEVSRAELAGSLLPGGKGVRFETDRAPFVFWSFSAERVLRTVEAVAPPGIVRWGKPKRIWLRP
jgi:hypothetical protein